MAELHPGSRYVRHHWQKLLGFCWPCASLPTPCALLATGCTMCASAMPPANYRCPRCCARYSPSTARRFEYQQPDEYRLDQQLLLFSQSLPQPGEACDSAYGFTPAAMNWPRAFRVTPLADGALYRRMRRRTGSCWMARPRWADAGTLTTITAKIQRHATSAAALSFAAMCRRCWRKSPPPGSAVLARSTPRRFWPANRDEGAGATGVFCQHLLSHFGEYRDALHSEQAFLFHSPLVVCAESQADFTRRSHQRRRGTVSAAAGRSAWRKSRALCARFWAGASMYAACTGRPCRNTAS